MVHEQKQHETASFEGTQSEGKGAPLTAGDTTAALIEATAVTLAALSQDELVKTLFSVDTPRLELMQDIIRFALSKPSDEADREEPPVIADGYDLTTFDRLAMRIVGNLVADAYLENNGTFETWDYVIQNVIESLRQGGNNTYIITSQHAPTIEIESWVHEKAAAILEATK